VLEGIALSQPALSLAAKILQRAERAGVGVPLPSGPGLGPTLLRLVADARSQGLDAEAALRQAALDLAAEIRKAEG
jgi:XTP/dITP diphosphohydrolase